MGLRNMRARAAEVGGDLQIESGDQGTTVSFGLTLPHERPIRVLIVEDSEAFVAGLQAALARWAYEVEIVGVAGDTQQATSLVQSLKPDIALLDLRISDNPEMQAADPRHGLQALAELGRTSQAHTVVMSFIHGPAWVQASAEMGAWAFWDKDQDVATLVGLLRRVMAGERVLRAEDWVDAQQEALLEDLTPREWEVLLCLDRGFSNQQIADELSVSVGTAAKHVENIRGKFGVSSRSEAVARARALGMLGGGQRQAQR